mmetsp:Transcript_106299/g.300605  ORF Transcript_106299/g.300605 Transcript_106299/m.300605 type:complete len:229 (+) Transcript_106299:2568-3254(+)
MVVAFLASSQVRTTSPAATSPIGFRDPSPSETGVDGRKQPLLWTRTPCTKNQWKRSRHNVTTCMPSEARSARAAARNRAVPATGWPLSFPNVSFPSSSPTLKPYAAAVAAGSIETGRCWPRLQKGWSRVAVILLRPSSRSTSTISLRHTRVMPSTLAVAGRPAASSHESTSDPATTSASGRREPSLRVTGVHGAKQPLPPQCGTVVSRIRTWTAHLARTMAQKMPSGN